MDCQECSCPEDWTAIAVCQWWFTCWAVTSLRCGASCAPEQRVQPVTASCPWAEHRGTGCSFTPSVCCSRGLTQALCEGEQICGPWEAIHPSTAPKQRGDGAVREGRLLPAPVSGTLWWLSWCPARSSPPSSQPAVVWPSHPNADITWEGWGKAQDKEPQPIRERGGRRARA